MISTNFKYSQLTLQQYQLIINIFISQIPLTSSKCKNNYSLQINIDNIKQIDVKENYKIILQQANNKNKYENKPTLLEKTTVQQVNDQLQQKRQVQFLPHSITVYQPKKDDYIIGIMKQKIYDGWLVDILQPSYRYAFLAKNYIIKETTQKEYYIFCQIKDYTPQTQINLKFNQKTCQVFSQNENTYLFRLPIQQCKDLIQNKEKQLIISRRIKFEIFIGVNGVIILNKVNQNEAQIIKAALINQVPTDQLDQFIRDQILM